MKQIFSGWTIGLTSSNGHKYFLGVYETSEGVKYGYVCHTPLVKTVYNYLFPTKEAAADFWKICYWWDYIIDKKQLSSIPVKIEISLDVSAIGFDWSGI